MSRPVMVNQDLCLLLQGWIAKPRASLCEAITSRFLDLIRNR
jgi:hypothetical protein